MVILRSAKLAYGKCYCRHSFFLVCNPIFVYVQDEEELKQISEQDGQVQATVRDMRQKVEEAKSSLSSTRSRGKVLDALMQQKRSGKIPGILGRLVSFTQLLQSVSPIDVSFKQ